MGFWLIALASAHWYSTESPITAPLEDEALLDDDVVEPPVDDEAVLLDDEEEALDDDAAPLDEEAATLDDDATVLDDALARLPPLPVVLEVTGPVAPDPLELVDVLDPPVPGRTGSSPVAHATTRAGPRARTAARIDLVETSFPRMAHSSHVTSAQ